MLICGNKLPPKMQDEVLRKFVKWRLDTQPGVPDRIWLRRTAFYIVNSGRLDARYKKGTIIAKKPWHWIPAMMVCILYMLPTLAVAPEGEPGMVPYQPFTVTAYTNSKNEVWPSYDGMTAGMVPAKHQLKLVAVDPKVIPLFSRVWIDNLGWYTAVDTGGKIKGERIDVLMASKSEAKAFGKRESVAVVIVPPRASREDIRNWMRKKLNGCV